MSSPDSNDHVYIGRSPLPARTNRCKRILKDLYVYRSIVIIVLAPILAAPLLFVTGEHEKQARCAYVVAIMGCYWMFEVLPLAVTALLPTFLYPLLGVLSSKEHISFLFTGGLIMALAVEKCGLHERVALKVLTIVGSQPKWIMLGFMGVTAFLSMWISNTATTAMMVPIATSVIAQLVQSKQNTEELTELESLKSPMIEANGDEKRDSEQTKSTSKPAPSSELDFSTLHGADRNMAKALLLSIAFAANVGGTGTLTGTPPNLVLVELFDARYPNATGYISFLAWMRFACPLMVVSVFFCWFALALAFFPWRDILSIFNPLSLVEKCRKRGRNSPAKSVDPIAQLIRTKYHQLPPMALVQFLGFAEWLVLILFGSLLALWIFRDPQVFTGFGVLFKKKYYSDATSAMLISLLLFILPNKKPDWLCWRENPNNGPTQHAALMDWNTMQHKFPWGVIILLGGGFAMAEGVNKSGLSSLIGNWLLALDQIDEVWLQLLCLIATTIVTNICSNVVTAVIFVQIVAQMAEKMHYHPLSFMAPTTLVCSYAFLLPVGTPPNAIVFASGLLKVSDMIRGGLLVTLFCLILIMLNMLVYAGTMWPLDTFPDWVKKPVTYNDTASWFF